MTINGWQTVEIATRGRHAALPDDQRTEIVPSYVDVTHVDFDRLVSPHTITRQPGIAVRTGIKLAAFAGSFLATTLVIGGLNGLLK